MPWWAIAIAGIAALGLFYGSFRAWRKARIIEDVPTSKIRSAAQGYVELEGIARADPDVPLQAPLTGLPCVWWEFRVEEYERRGRSRSWRTVDRGRSQHALILEDSTGHCFIHPDRAGITTSHKQVWRGSQRRPPQTRAIKTFSLGRYRYTERRFHDGDPIYALGYFETLRPPTADEIVEKRSNELLAEWKADYDAMVRRFDRNGDGDIDLEEWEHVRAAARREAYASAAESYDATPVNVMVYPPHRNQPYIIANKDPKRLTRGYRWQAAGMLSAAAGLAGFIFYQLAV